MSKPVVREVIVVEGRYDKHAVLGAVDAVVIETGGFGVFSDREKVALLRTLAEEHGVIVLTDGDGAGFVIRGHLKGALPKGLVKQAYIPDIIGKERRKAHASREGKLGVEGMSKAVIVDALRKAGATFDDEQTVGRRELSRSLLFELKLSGGDGSAARRDALKKRMNLPQKLSAPALFNVLGALVSDDELRKLCAGIDEKG